ncbi:copper oxidase, partial [Agrobacterium sp. S2]|nr:copper oxidase [Agrobacterium sp. S2]MBM7330478.1 copper oxidase [Agrobacterium sp. S2]
MFNRRQLLGVSAAMVSSAAWAKTSNSSLPEAAVMETAATQAPVKPTAGPDYNPVVTLNGW